MRSGLRSLLTAIGLDVSEYRWSLVLLYAVLCRKMAASMDFLLRVLLGVERPAALPTHSILSLMNGIDPHRLSDILAEADGVDEAQSAGWRSCRQSAGESFPSPKRAQFSQARSKNGPLVIVGASLNFCC